jgi:F-type H+-transporting ATPase subunit delta
MNRHGRTGLLPELHHAYVLRVEEWRGQIEVKITSAVELDTPEKAAAERVAAELSGKSPVIKWLVDATVVGGLVLQIGDLRYDNSIRRHLAVARERLLSRTQRGELNWGAMLETADKVYGEGDGAAR